jgi:hypothetical protein
MVVLANLQRLTGQTLAVEFTDEERHILDEVKTWPPSDKGSLDFWFALGRALNLLAVKGIYYGKDGPVILRRQEGLDGYPPNIVTDARKLARGEAEVRAWIAAQPPTQRGLRQQAIKPGMVIRNCPVFGYPHKATANAQSKANLKARIRELETQVFSLKAQLAEKDAPTTKLTFPTKGAR